MHFSQARKKKEKTIFSISFKIINICSLDDNRLYFYHQLNILLILKNYLKITIRNLFLILDVLSDFSC